MSRKKLVSLLLSVLLLLAAAVPAVSVHAADSVTVTLVFTDGETIRPFFDLTVADGTAEAYGLTPAEKDHAGKPVETVTVLDAVVQAHAALYGDAFTAETAGNYLSAENSYCTCAFGQFKAFGFAVNDATPHDDVLVTTEWGSFYTGYSIDTARLQNGDVVTFYTMQDLTAWSDIYPFFSEKNYTAVEDHPFRVGVTGYGMMMLGCNEQSVIDAGTVPLKGAELYLTKSLDGALTPAGTLDADGAASVTVKEPGAWYLVVKGTANKSPVIPLFSKITVEANPTKNTQLNVPAPATVGYKSTVTVSVSASGVPEGFMVALYDGDFCLVDGDNSVSCYMERLTENRTFTAKIIDQDGNVQFDADGKLEKDFTVSVKTGFFARLKAFFLGLFGLLPKIELNP